MNKQVVILLLKQQPVKPEDLVEFILDSIKHKNGPEPTPEQLQGILKLIQVGIFDLRNALAEAVNVLNLQVVRLYSVSGELIKIDVYEK